jgi:hypothetical protein
VLLLFLKYKIFKKLKPVFRKNLKIFEKMFML